MNKGQIQFGVIVGILATAILGVAGWNLVGFSKNSDEHLEISTEAAILKTRVERLPIIEEKLDRLLEREGIKYISGLEGTTTRR